MNNASAIGDIGTVYRTIKSLSQTAHIDSIHTSDGTKTCCPTDIANAFRNHFRDSLNRQKPQQPLQEPAAYPPAFNINVDPPTLREIENTVSGLKLSKAPGPE